MMQQLNDTRSIYVNVYNSIQYLFIE